MVQPMHLLGVIVYSLLFALLLWLIVRFVLWCKMDAQRHVIEEADIEAAGAMLREKAGAWFDRRAAKKQEREERERRDRATDHGDDSGSGHSMVEHITPPDDLFSDFL